MNFASSEYTRDPKTKTRQDFDADNEWTRCQVILVYLSYKHFEYVFKKFEVRP